MLCAYGLALLIAGQTPAQPDFSGRWVLTAPAPAPADVPSVLVIRQHLTRTDIRGNPMEPFWDSLTVAGDDGKSGIRSGNYRMGVSGGVVGGIVGGDTPGLPPPTPITQESVSWQGDTLVMTSEEWMQREGGTRESYRRHREAWALDGQGRLVITVSDSNGEERTRTITYEKERSRR